jgi:hypothetical protein
MSSFLAILSVLAGVTPDHRVTTWPFFGINKFVRRAGSRDKEASATLVGGYCGIDGWWRRHLARLKGNSKSRKDNDTDDRCSPIVEAPIFKRGWDRRIARLQQDSDGC